jgi:DNA-binding CsgD family transcriptional regulator
MNPISDLYLKIENFYNLQSLVHVFMFDNKNSFCYANEIQLTFIEETLKINKKDIIGMPIEQILAYAPESAKILIQENETVRQLNQAKQFYNSMVFNEIYHVEMITIKFPVYDKDNKIAGVFGIGHFLNRFSFTRAHELGLAKRETECLFYILEGKSNKEIAKYMKISFRTVENYVENIKHKLNCSTKSEVILSALKSKITNNTKDDIISTNRPVVISKDISAQ